MHVHMRDKVTHNTLFFVVLICCLGQDAVSADPNPTPLTPDRPGFTNGSDVVLRGRTQLEIGLAETVPAASATSPVTIDLPEALLRIGNGNHLEFRVSMPDYVSPRRSSKGIGDAALGLKFQPYESKDGNTKASIIAMESMPTGGKQFGTGHFDPSLTIGYQTVSGSRWQISTNAQLSEPTQAGHRVQQAAITGAISYSLTQSLSAYADAIDQGIQGSKPFPVVDFGFTLTPNPNNQFDGELGLGLGGIAPVRFFGIGWSTRM